MTVDSTKAKIVEKLQFLSEPALQQVLEFVDNLTQLTTHEEDPLLSVIGILSGESLCSAEIEQELYGDESRFDYLSFYLLR